MSDASSIRRTTSVLAPPPYGSAVGTLPPETQAGAGFFEGGLRFQLSGANYQYLDPVTNKYRNTGIAYYNTGSQWMPIGTRILTVPLIAGLPLTQTVFIADRAYSIQSIVAYNNVAVASTYLNIVSTPPQPLVSIVDPTGAGSGAIVEAVVTAGTGAIASYTVIEGGASYGTGTYAVVTGPNTTQAVPGTVTLGTGAVSSIALGTAGSGYNPAQTPGSVVGTTITAGGTGYSSSGNTYTYAAAAGNNGYYGTMMALNSALTQAGGIVSAVAISTAGTGFVLPPTATITSGGGNATVTGVLATQNNVLSSPISLAATANYTQTAALSSTIANTQLQPGSKLHLMLCGSAGTSAETSGIGVITIVLQPS